MGPKARQRETSQKARPALRRRASRAQSKALVIVESPAKAKTINKYLGDGYVVKATMGHVRDLPETRFGIEIEKGFQPTYRIIKGKKATIEELKKVAKDAAATYLATDPDREGEAIAWHVKECLRLDEDRTYRVRFNEITGPAIRAAFEHPDHIDMNKVYAQQARRVLDRIVGYQLSPLLWKKVARGLSAGRVQSVAVRLVVEREREIQSFQPQEYWKITGTFVVPGLEDQPFQAELTLWRGDKFRPNDRDEALQVLQQLQGERFSVSTCRQRQRAENPPPPFMTSTLQQQASIRLRFSANRTMRIAQQLYEGLELGSEGSVGLITYMRTDSLRVAEGALEQCRHYIQEQFGSDYLPEQPRRYKSRQGAQEAHEAIRPTDLRYTPEFVRPYLTDEQFLLYELIFRRFVASQMKPAVIAVTEVEIQAGEALFRTQGQKVLFEGYRRVWAPSGTHEEVTFPPLQEGLELTCTRLEPSQHFTQPPPRYTEATLIKALEKHGIGRPSTYAPIISTIQERGYVQLKDRKFYATELGMLVTDLLVQHFPEIIDVDFTSQMESRLDAIEEAKAHWQEVLQEFYEPFQAALQKAEQIMEQVRGAESGESCEQCGAPMVLRWSKAGRFLGCSRYPECRSRKALPNADGDPGRITLETEHLCPECGRKLLLRQGRLGPFLSCSGYPECKVAMGIDAEGQPVARQQQTEHTCEQCGAPMVLKQSRRGPFLSCSNYPECRNSKPVDGEGRVVAPPAIDITCDQCGSPMKLRRSRRGPFLGCSNYPTCKKTMPVPEELREAVQEFLRATSIQRKSVPLEQSCPQCGQQLALRETARGLWVSCTNYPRCRYKERPSAEILARLANSSVNTASSSQEPLDEEVENPVESPEEASVEEPFLS
jgi:DNA topoisomerase-1